MGLRPLVASCTLSIAVLASQPVEGSAILFNDRGEFNAALNGDYQLFTEFPITDFSLISSLVGIGDYGGVRFAADPFNQIQFFGGVLSAYPRYDLGFLGASLTKQVTAIGFDLIGSNIYFPSGPAGSGLFDSSPIATNTLFSFETENGLVVQSSLAPAAFFGVLLLDDAFSNLGWFPQLNFSCDFCAKSVAIDNLAVQSVPEPSSALLVFIGVSALIVARRRRASASASLRGRELNLMDGDALAAHERQKRYADPEHDRRPSE